MPKLVIKKGDTVLKKLAVPDDILAFTVGSEQGNDIIINENSISFFHVQFEKQLDDYYVRDLQSQTGTFINGSRISSRTVLNNHDDIGVGSHMITFVNNSHTDAIDHGQFGDTELISKNHPNPVPSLAERAEGAAPVLNRLNQWLETDEDGSGDDDSDKNLPVEQENMSSATADESTLQPDNDASNVINPPTDESATAVKENESLSADVIELPDFLLDPEPVATGGNETGDETSKPKATSTRSQEITSKTAERANYYLLGIYGYYLGRKFRIKTGMTRIGRDRQLNDIVIAKNASGELDKSVSRRQASIRGKDSLYFLIDKRSQSRTALNNHKIASDEALAIKTGDEIEIESDKKNHIFRMVENGNLDFSFPRKSGPWHVRNRNMLLHSFSVVVSALAILFFVDAFRNSYIVNSTPGELKIENKLWKSTAIKTATEGQSEQRMFTATSDFDSDGITDVILTDGSGKLTCFSGRDKSILWSAQDFQAHSNLPVTVGDLHNDGHDDIVLISDDLRVRAVDGKWGLEIWKSPILAGPLLGPPAVLDLNGDSLNDAAIASEAQLLYLGYSGAKNATWQQMELPDIPTAVLSAADLRGDKSPSIVIGTVNGLILLVNGQEKRITHELNISEELSKATGEYIKSSKIVGPTGIADLDGDKILDLVVMTGSGHVLAINGSNMTRLWYDIAPVANSSNQRITSVILGDFDSDSNADVAMINPDGHLRVLKGMGQGGDRKMLLWEQTSVDMPSANSLPAVADFNKNGTDDIIVLNRLGSLLIFEGSDGSVILNQTLSDRPPQSPPLIADFDNDNNLDLLALQSDARLHIWNTNRTIPAGNVVWAQTFGNSGNTLYSSFSEPGGGHHYIYMILSIFAILSIIAVQFLFKRSRNRLSEYT